MEEIVKQLNEILKAKAAVEKRLDDEAEVGFWSWKWRD